MARICSAANQGADTARASFGLERPSVSVQRNRAIRPPPRLRLWPDLSHGPRRSFRPRLRGVVAECRACCDETRFAMASAFLVSTAKSQHLHSHPARDAWLEASCSCATASDGLFQGLPHLPLPGFALAHLHACAFYIGWPG